jgi:hypothetical protein
VEAHRVVRHQGSLEEDIGSTLKGEVKQIEGDVEGVDLWDFIPWSVHVLVDSIYNMTLLMTSDNVHIMMSFAAIIPKSVREKTKRQAFSVAILI